MGSTALAGTHVLDEETKIDEVACTPQAIGMCTLYIHVNDTCYEINVYNYVVVDTFAEDPNIVRPDDTGDYVALDSDGEFEGSSVYDDDDDIDWVEPDPGSDDETNTPTDVILTPPLSMQLVGWLQLPAVPCPPPYWTRCG